MIDIIKQYTNELSKQRCEIMDKLTKEVLGKLNYNIEEVFRTKGDCVKEDVGWIYHLNTEYLYVNGELFCEVKLERYSEGYNYKVHKHYE